MRGALPQRLFRLLHHYAHAFERRALLSSEYLRQRRLHPDYPGGMLKRIWRDPGAAEDLLHFSRFLAPSERILLLDAGGNSGYWAADFVELFRHTQVVAFEPDPRAAAAYRRRFTGRDGIELHPLALSSRGGRGRLNLGERTTFSSLEHYADSQQGREIGVVGDTEVELARLDELPLPFEGCERSLLKIDVQGHELEVLEGARGVLERIDLVFAELSFAEEYRDKEPSFAPVTELLRASGHYPILFQDHGRDLGPYAWECDVLFAKRQLLDGIWGW